MAAQGFTKKQIMEKAGHTVAVDDVTLSINEGETS
jgi:ABC-type proline/glycine betaine transport system ATPase subunit